MAPSTERRMLSRLATLLRPHHDVHVWDAPLRLVAFDAGATVTVMVTVEQAESGSGVTIEFHNQETNKLYGTSADIHVVARRVRTEVTDPARQALIAAHDILLQHLPSSTGRCIPCGERMPCAAVAAQIKIMDEYGHLDAWEALSAEQGGHACTDWIYPYKF